MITRRALLPGAIIGCCLPSIGTARASKAPLVGTYGGNPDGNDRHAMAVFEAAFDAHAAAVGHIPQCMNGFASDNGKGWSAVVDQMEWTAWRWSLSSRSNHLIPVIGIPMALSDKEVIQNYKDIANGVYDRVWSGISEAWGRSGFHEVYFRIGWEFNGNWYNCQINGLSARERLIWISAWRRIAQGLQSTAALAAKTVWNPSAIAWESFGISAVYPGDTFVDVMGLDLYSTVSPNDLYDWDIDNGTMDPTRKIWMSKARNREHFWDYPGATMYRHTENNAAVGTPDFLAFASAHRKPITIPETGVGINPNYPHNGISDDADFPKYLLARLTAAGAPPIEFVNIWDVDLGDGHWKFSGCPSPQPKAKAAWRRFVAGLSARSGIQP